MTKIDDIVAFALSQPDYLLEFLTNDELPKELDDKEQSALDAARKHVERALADLMGGAANALAKAIEALPTRYLARSLLQNRVAAVKIPKLAEKMLYRMLVTLEVEPKQSAKLCVSLETKKAAQSQIVNAVKAKGLQHLVSGYRITAPGIELGMGLEFASVNEQVAKQGRALFDCVRDDAAQ